MCGRSIFLKYIFFNEMEMGKTQDFFFLSHSCLAANRPGLPDDIKISIWENFGGP
jgi:hypothetical protein